MDIEHLVIKGTALREQLKKAEVAFDECFKRPVRDWLRTQPGLRATVMGVAEPYLRTGKEKLVIDENSVLEDIRAAVFAGQLSPAELGTAVLNGTFNIGSPELAAQLATSKTGKAYLVLKAANIGEALMWDGVDKESVGKITTAYHRIEDLEDVVRGAARTPLRQDVIDELTQKSEVRA